MSFKEQTYLSSCLYSGKIMRVYCDEVILPDGSHSKREYLRHAQGAAVLFVKDNKIALVKQYRYVYGKEVAELPAGKVEEGETPLNAALRELEEETGYRAQTATLITKIYPSPGYTDEVIHIFLVEDAQFVGQNCDEGEFLSSAFYPVEDVVKMIDSGEIADAKTVAGVLKYCLNAK